MNLERAQQCATSGNQENSGTATLALKDLNQELITFSAAKIKLAICLTVPYIPQQPQHLIIDYS